MARVRTMDIHTNVDIRNQITSAKIFQLIAFRIAVNASEYDVAFSQSGQSSLPAPLDGENICLRVNCEYRSLRNSNLGSAFVDIRRDAADCTVMILVLIMVHIAQDKA